MQLKFSDSTNTGKVTLPQEFAKGQPFRAHLDGKVATLVWHANQATLSRCLGNQMEENFNVRSIRVGPKDPLGKSMLQLEFVTKCGRSRIAHLQFSHDAPGQESRMAALGSRPVTVAAPMTGNVLKVEISDGQVVTAGDLLCVIEAMKMENRIEAPIGGIITGCTISAGTQIEVGANVATIKPQTDT